jgi:hypothetical protein
MVRIMNANLINDIVLEEMDESFIASAIIKYLKKRTFRNQQ